MRALATGLRRYLGRVVSMIALADMAILCEQAGVKCDVCCIAAGEYALIV